MTLRKRTFWAMFGILVALIPVLYLSSSAIFAQEYTALEQERVGEALKRTQDLLEGFNKGVEQTARSYAFWDETYALMVESTPAAGRFLIRLDDETLKNLQVDFMLFYDRSGKYFAGRLYDYQSNQVVAPPERLIEQMRYYPPSHLLGERKSASGTVLFEENGPLVLGLAQILPSDGAGENRGVLVVGKYLRAADVEQLSEQLGYRLSIQRLDKLQQTSEMAAILNTLADRDEPLVEVKGDQIVVGSILSDDIQGLPNVLVQIEMPRTVYNRWPSLQAQWVTLLLIIGLVSVAIIIGALELLVIRPMLRLSARLDQIDESGDLDERISPPAHGEMRRFTEHVNGLLGRLQEARRRHIQDEEHLQRRLDETLLLNRVIEKAAQSDDVEAVLTTVCRELALFMHLPQAAATLLDEDRKQLVVRAEYCEAGRPSVIGFRIPLENNPSTRYVLDTQEPLVLANAQLDTGAQEMQDIAKNRGTVSLLIVPLLSGKQSIGTLGLDALEARSFREDEIRIARSVAAAVGPALDKVALSASVQRELLVRQQAEAALRRQEELLSGLALSASNLLITADYEQAVTRALADLGRSMQADRAYLFEYVPDKNHNQPRVRLHFDWLGEQEANETLRRNLREAPGMVIPERWHQILATGKHLMGAVDDFPEDERTALLSRKVVSLLVVPISIRGAFWGFLGFDVHVAGHNWSEAEVAAAYTLAGSLGGLLARRQAEEELRSQYAYLESLHETSLGLMRRLQLGELLENIMMRAGQLAGCENGYLYLYDEHQDILRLEVGLGVYRNFIGLTLGPGEGMAGRILREHKSMLISDYTTWPGRSDKYPRTLLYSTLGVPLMVGQRVAGVVGLGEVNPEHLLTEEHVRIIERFAQLASIALDNALLYHRLQSELEERKRTEELLESAKADLESRVEERTAELLRINEQIALELERRKQAERALREERSLLARRVQERTEELSAANAELKMANELKSKFIANINHEFRTPLTSISSLAEALLEQAYGPLSALQAEKLHLIHNSSKHLSSLVEDILDFSSLEAGKLKVEIGTLTVQSVCQTCLELIEQAARQKGLQVEVEIDPLVVWIQADPLRLNQILLNLLSNAVKFTPFGRRIGLRVTGDITAGRVHFTVWDTGIGIAPESMRHLFQPFIQLDNRISRQFPGTGLGLVLAYRLIQLHDGAIAVESQPGEGSRFTVTLRWSPPPGGHSSMLSSGLQIDASPDSTIQLTRFLNEIGMETTLYPRDEGAVEKATELHPDIFLIDVPGGSAPDWDIVRQLRRNPQTAAVPVVVLATGEEHYPDADGGVIVYATKPLPLPDLRNALRRVSPKGTARLWRRALVVVPSREPVAGRSLILLVDDNQASIAIHQQFLMASGYQVILAHNGSEAIQRAWQERPNLILMDMRIAGIDGLEAVRRIRMNEVLARLPIILMNALELPGDRQRCLEAGADEYVSKPVDLYILADMIKRMLLQYGREERRDG